MKLNGKQTLQILWASAGISTVWYGYVVLRDRRKRKGIERWLKAECEGIEIERRDRGL